MGAGCRESTSCGTEPSQGPWRSHGGRPSLTLIANTSHLIRGSHPGRLCPQGASGNVWRQFWLSGLGAVLIPGGWRSRIPQSMLPCSTPPTAKNYPAPTPKGAETEEPVNHYTRVIMWIICWKLRPVHTSESSFRFQYSSVFPRNLALSQVDSRC